MITKHRRLAAVALASALALSACSDSTEPEAATTPSETDAMAEETPTPTEDAMGPETYEITATDYAFSGIPAEIAAGSTLTLTNASEAEVHEIVAVNVGDDERPLPDVLADFGAAMESGEIDLTAIALVVVQGPGGQPTIPAIGDGTLTAPGRYVFICAIQQGADPEAYFAEAARMQEAGEEGPVMLEDAGAPHLTLGMVAEAHVV